MHGKPGQRQRFPGLSVGQYSSPKIPRVAHAIYFLDDERVIQLSLVRLMPPRNSGHVEMTDVPDVLLQKSMMFPLMICMW